LNRRQTIPASTPTLREFLWLTSSPTRMLIARTRWLAHWLSGRLPRAAKQSRARARIRRIVELLQELQSALRPGTPVWKLPAIGRIESELQTLTRRYESWPRFGASGDARYIGVAHMWKRGSLEETISLQLIEELLKSKMLHGLTFCETCEVNWVFRRGEKGKYCSRECRQAVYEATPQRKEAKRMLSREHYWNETYGKFSRRKKKER
jgi:hypothetical protein